MLNQKTMGKTPKWMVKIMEIPIKMDNLGGFNTPYFYKHHPYPLFVIVVVVGKLLEHDMGNFYLSILYISLFMGKVFSR